MKNIIRIALLSAGLISVTTSCSDFLDQAFGSTEDITPVVFNDKERSQLAVNKLYGYLTDATYGQQIPIIFGTGTDCELIDGLGNEATNTTSERGNMNYNYSPSWNTLNTAWNNIYSIINDANVMIEGIEASSLYNGGDETLKRLYGEVLTIRAMAYLDLTRMWGDVPAVMDSDPESKNIYRAKTDRDEIQDQCIADLQKAIDLLPWAGEQGSTTERVTKGYAYGLLAQTALTRAGYSIREAAKSGYEDLPVYSDAKYPTQRPAKADRDKYYQIAAEACAAVIKSGKHRLNPSFENEWKLINQTTLDTEYQENLFETANGVGVTGELGYTVGKRINGATEYLGGKGNSSGKLKLTGQLWATYDNTGNVGDANGSFVAKDKRRDVTFSLFELKEATGFKYYDQVHNEKLFYDNYAGKAPFALYCGKWNPLWWKDNLVKVAQSANDAKWTTGINYVRMRYSQVLLNYAEACYMLGGAGHSVAGGPSALEALEEVHCRAYDDKAAGKAFIDELANADFMEAICKENAWEFAGEGVRKWDLIRWGKLSEKILQAKIELVDGVKNQPSQGGYPRTMFYRFKTVELEGGKFQLLQADESTFCWYGTAQYPIMEGKTRYNKTNCMSQTWFADNTIGDNLNVNLPSICDGLNPWNEIPVANEAYRGTQLFKGVGNTSVKNRYILPLGSLTVSASNGMLENSYGF